VSVPQGYTGQTEQPFYKNEKTLRKCPIPTPNAVLCSINSHQPMLKPLYAIRTLTMNMPCLLLTKKIDRCECCCLGSTRALIEIRQCCECFLNNADAALNPNHARFEFEPIRNISHPDNYSQLSNSHLAHLGQL